LLEPFHLMQLILQQVQCWWHIVDQRVFGMRVIVTMQNLFVQFLDQCSIFLLIN